MGDGWRGWGMQYEGLAVSKIVDEEVCRMCQVCRVSRVRRGLSCASDVNVSRVRVGRRQQSRFKSSSEKQQEHQQPGEREKVSAGPFHPRELKRCESRFVSGCRLSSKSRWAIIPNTPNEAPTLEIRPAHDLSPFSPFSMPPRETPVFRMFGA